LSWPGVVGSAVIPTVPSVTGAILLKTYGQSFINNNMVPTSGVPTTFKLPTCGPIGITKPTDVTTASFLASIVALRPVIPKLTVTFTAPGSTAGTVVVPVQIVLLNAQIVGLSQAVDTQVGSTAALSDSISLLATTFEVTYTPQLANGALGTAQKFGWNCVAGTPVAF
jgi:hypothetical protein